MQLKPMFLAVFFTLSLAALFVLSLAAPAFAEDCSAMLRDLTSYASLTSDVIFSPETYKIVKVKMATNRPDSQYVSYAQGELKRFEAFLPRPTPTLIAEGLEGDSSQTFSDRVVILSDPSCSGPLCGYAQPFNAREADALGISIGVDARITLTLNSWGGGKVRFNGTCSNNILYGSTPDGTFFTFSFVKADLSGNPR